MGKKKKKTIRNQQREKESGMGKKQEKTGTSYLQRLKRGVKRGILPEGVSFTKGRKGLAKHDGARKIRTATKLQEGMLKVEAENK